MGIPVERLWSASLNRRTAQEDARKTSRETSCYQCSPRNAEFPGQVPRDTEMNVITLASHPGEHRVSARPHCVCGTRDRGLYAAAGSSGQPGTRAPEAALPTAERTDRVNSPSVQSGDTSECIFCFFSTKINSKKISVMILPQVHLRKPCYDFYFL